MPTGNGQSAKEAYLAELRAEIDRLSALVAAVESGGAVLTGNGTTGTTPGSRPAETQVRPDSFFGMTTPQAVRKFLEMMGKGNPQTPAAIADALIRGGQEKPENKDTVLKNVYTAFKRGKDVDFVKIHKQWGLTKLYPNRKGAEEKPVSRKVKKRKRSAFHTFMSEQLSTGKSKNLKEAQAAWREHKGAA